jgi:hypothetical protein
MPWCKENFFEGFRSDSLSSLSEGINPVRHKLPAEDSMRIAYLTIDEVNRDTAKRAARQCGAILSPLLPRDPPPDGRFDAAVYDFDYLPAAERRSVLDALCKSPLPHPAAVHAYHLERSERLALRAAGVIVRRRLGLALIRALRQACYRSRRSAASLDDSSLSVA